MHGEPQQPLERAIAIATRRLRQRRFRRDLPRALGVAAGLGYLLGWITLLGEAVEPVLAWYWLAGMLIAGAAVLALAGPVSPHRACRAIDRAMDLPDQALGALESGSGGGFWSSRILREAWTALHDPSLAERIAAPWSRWSGIVVAGFLGVGVILTTLVWARNDPETAGVAARGEARAVMAIREELETWEMEPEDPEIAAEWRQIREALKPFSAELARPDVSREEVLAALSRVEDRIAEAREALQENRLEDSSEALSQGLEAARESRPAARAVEQREFARAAEALEEAARRLEREPPADPESAEEERGAQAESMEQAAKELREAGHQQAAEGMEQVAQGMRQGDREQMAEGMREMAGAARRESLRQQQTQSLSGMQQQAREMKEDLGEKPGQGRARGRESKPGEEPGGLEAGTGEHDDPFGNPTRLVGQRDPLQVTGELGEGQSQRVTEKSEQGDAGAVSGGAADGGAPASGPVSNEVIDDESIPLPYRSVIRDYFERIRPGASEGGSR